MGIPSSPNVCMLAHDQTKQTKRQEGKKERRFTPAGQVWAYTAPPSPSLLLTTPLPSFLPSFLPPFHPLPLSSTYPPTSTFAAPAPAPDPATTIFPSAGSPRILCSKKSCTSSLCPMSIWLSAVWGDLTSEPKRLEGFLGRSGCQTAWSEAMRRREFCEGGFVGLVLWGKGMGKGAEMVVRGGVRERGGGTEGDAYTVVPL